MQYEAEENLRENSKKNETEDIYGNLQSNQNFHAGACGTRET